MVWTGWIITALIGAFLLVDGGARVAGFAPYIEGMTKLGTRSPSRCRSA